MSLTDLQSAQDDPSIYTESWKSLLATLGELQCRHVSTSRLCILILRDAFPTGFPEHYEQ